LVFKSKKFHYFKSLTNGDTGTLDVFYSTTHDYDVIEDFAEEVVIELDADKNTDVLLICDRGETHGESEILFKPTQKVEYTKVFRDDEGVLHVRCKTIDDNEKQDIHEWFNNIISYI
jgi:hypothetical protein